MTDMKKGRRLGCSSCDGWAAYNGNDGNSDVYGRNGGGVLLRHFLVNFNSLKEVVLSYNVSDGRSRYELGHIILKD